MVYIYICARKNIKSIFFFSFFLDLENANEWTGPQELRTLTNFKNEAHCMTIKVKQN